MTRIPDSTPPQIPQEPKQPRPPRQVRSMPSASKEQPSSISIPKAVKGVTNQEKEPAYLEPHFALYYLAKAEVSEWLAPFCLELALRPQEVQDKAWQFLASDKASAKLLKELARRFEYEELAKYIPTGKELVAKYIGHAT